MVDSTIYNLIEEYYGDVFDSRLAARIVRAPVSELRELRDRCPIPPDDPPPLEYGQIRPMIFTRKFIGEQALGYERDDTEEFLRALHTLLKAHEVLMDLSFAIPFHRLRFIGMAGPFKPEPFGTDPPSPWQAREADRRKEHEHRERRGLAGALNRLQIIRPFVETGAIRFGAVRLRQSDMAGYAYEMAFRVAEAASGAEILELERLLPGGPFPGDVSLESRLVGQGVGMTRALELARDRRATPVSRSRVEDLMWGHILSAAKGDERIASLETLGRIGFPDFASNPEALVRLRCENEALGVWREKLSQAIRDLGEISWNEELTSAHREHFSGMMHEGLAAYSPEERRSSALRALRTGSTEFVVSGVVGAVVGLAGGQAVGAAVPGSLLGSAAGAASSLVHSYAESRQKARANKLIWDVWLGMDVGGDTHPNTQSMP